MLSAKHASVGKRPTLELYYVKCNTKHASVGKRAQVVCNTDLSSR